MAAGDQWFYVGPVEEPDKYRLLRSVSSGGEAELWEANLVVAGERERVAVKILRSNHSADLTRWRARWTDQVEMLRLVRHPSVVGVHEQFEGVRMHPRGHADTADRTLYLVMNWVEGADLRDWVPQHTGPEDRVDAFRYLSQIANVLDWLHSGQATPSGRPVIHGDVTPSNVIINKDGQAVLVDFGLFRMARHVTTMAAGTQGYIAPEVLKRGEYSPASDRYAFGGLAFYLLTGTHPPTDPKQLRAAMVKLAGLGDKKASVSQLATIFADDPKARPSTVEWLRSLRLHSSTAPVRPGAMPPLAPNAADPRQAPAPTPPPRPAVRLPKIPAGTRAAVLTIGLTMVIGLLFCIGLVWLSNLVSNGEDPNNADNGRSGASSTAPIDQQAGVVSPGTVIWLVDVDPVEGGDGWIRGPEKIDAGSYERSLSYETGCGEVIVGYNLGRSHTRFQATIGLNDNAPRDKPMRFVVQLDDRTAVTRDLRLGQHADIDIDVRGVLRLELGVDFPCYFNDRASGVFGNARVIK